MDICAWGRNIPIRRPRRSTQESVLESGLTAPADFPADTQGAGFGGCLEAGLSAEGGLGFYREVSYSTNRFTLGAEGEFGSNSAVFHTRRQERAVSRPRVKAPMQMMLALLLLIALSAE